MERSTVAVIGGAGRVGFGLCLVLADAGHTVIGVDRDEATNTRILAGEVPFREEHAVSYLQRALAGERLTMTSSLQAAGQADIVVIVIGTPIDSHLNPRVDVVEDLLTELVPHLRRGQLIVLRSTLKPGTTELVKVMIEETRKWRCGSDFDLVVAPDRVLQGKAIEELGSLPQLVGAFDDHGYDRTTAFVSTYSHHGCVRLSPVEAELGKLISNVARYLSFSFANEIHLIADVYGTNATRIIDAINYGFDRLQIPVPGPNTAGPCLFKDSFYLIEDIPFADLISVALRINEGMTAHIVGEIKGMPSVRKVTILGMAYKADNDDTRDSLSFKLKKQLLGARYDVTCFDPLVPGYQDPEVLHGADCAVLMTPHAEFSDLRALAAHIDNPACQMIDLWGLWQDMRHRSQNGTFQLCDALASPKSEEDTVGHRR